MATLTECPDCGKYFTAQRCECGFELPTRHETPVTPTPAWMLEPPACTQEENERAHHLVWALMAREITTQQAHRVLKAIFRGRDQ